MGMLDKEKKEQRKPQWIFNFGRHKPDEHDREILNAERKLESLNNLKLEKHQDDDY